MKKIIIIDKNFLKEIDRKYNFLKNMTEWIWSGKKLLGNKNLRLVMLINCQIKSEW